MQGGTIDRETGQELDNELFLALRDHKQRATDRLAAIHRDNQSIAETMHKKQLESDENASVVTACASYASNKNYVRINGGLDHRIRLEQGIHPLNPDECDVYTTLVEQSDGSTITALPNHHITPDGDLEGFKFACNGQAMSRSLPINRKMFFRYSMVECTQDYCSDRQAILTLLRDQKTVRERLQALVRRIHADSIGVEASFDCMPESADVIENGMHPSSASRTTADCRRWNPEMPEFVGLYHAYVKGFNKETRTHRLFLVTSGGCSAMCDNYFNLSVDVRNDMSCRQVLDSEETWFLRKACQRNNARVLASVAMEFGLAIPMVSDPYAYEPCSIASCTTETLQYDMVGSKDGRIAFMNKCVETMSCRNGVLCSMHPSEGVWLFKGPLQTNSSMTIYGGKRVQARPICTGG